MSELSMNPDDYDLSKPEEIQRFLMVAQAELLKCLHTIETYFSKVTECFATCDISSGSDRTLLQVDKITYQYIMALISMHLFYQQLLKIRDIDTPAYWSKEITSL